MDVRTIATRPLKGIVVELVAVLVVHILVRKVWDAMPGGHFGIVRDSRVDVLIK